MKFKVAIIGLLAGLIALVIYFGTNQPEVQEKKVAYIQNAQVYTSFEMTKELDAQLEQYVTSKSAVLDSLELRLQFLAKSIEQTNDESQMQQFVELKQQFNYLEEDFYKGHEQLRAEYHEQITTQMNEYIKSFGEEGQYDYLFGANGNGNLMYASEGEDVTAEVIAFINEKYKGA